MRCFRARSCCSQPIFFMSFMFFMVTRCQALAPLIALAAVANLNAGTTQAFLRPLDVSTPIPYFVADGRGKTGFRSSDLELARWAFDAWQRTAANTIRFVPSPESGAIVRLYWAEPTEGQY